MSHAAGQPSGRAVGVVLGLTVGLALGFGAVAGPLRAAPAGGEPRDHPTTVSDAGPPPIPADATTPMPDGRSVPMTAATRTVWPDDAPTAGDEVAAMPTSESQLRDGATVLLVVVGLGLFAGFALRRLRSPR
jgi:hypothetical protein